MKHSRLSLSGQGIPEIIAHDAAGYARGFQRRHGDQWRVYFDEGAEADEAPEGCHLMGYTDGGAWVWLDRRFNTENTAATN